MNSSLPTKEQAIELLQRNHCSTQVISHCQTVADIALEIARRLNEKGVKIDLQLVLVGALLHDIGRSKTNGVNHGVDGAGIAEKENLPEAVATIIRKHVGGGFTAPEAIKLGWPSGDYMPSTLEEKVVSYADKLADSSKGTKAPIEVEINRLKAAGHNEAAERVYKMHQEINGLLGDY